MIGIYDMHCHLIPGVDDGSVDMDMTRELLKVEYEQGVRCIYLTSHYRKGMFETDAEYIRQQFELVKEEAKKISPELQVRLGCEFHACMDMTDMLKRKERPTMGDSRFVLIEFSGRHDYKMIQERCYALLSSGYTPIIAHAERYPALFKKYDYLEQLINMGAYIQVNANSILGLDGFWMKQFCKKIMKKELLHFIGSDAHDLGERASSIGPCAEYIEKLMGINYAKRILIENPKLLEN